MTKLNQTATTAPETPKVEGPTYEALLAEHKTVSAVIRFLAGQGKTRSEIAKFTGKRYQHVRNVLTAPVKQKSE